MKTNKFLALFSIIAMSFAIISCVQDDDFTVPNSLGDEENVGLQAILTGLNNGDLTSISINDLKDQFVFGEATQIVSDIVVKGYVSSSDRTGNFYKEFYLQDDPTNPTSAIKVVLNQVDSYNQFNIGREVYIKLKDLYVGETRSGDDVIAIGGDTNAEGDEVEDLTANQIPLHIFRSDITEIITPVILNFSQINDSHIGMYVMIEEAQFPLELAGESFVDPLDDFDTSRELQGCEGFSYTSFDLETSSFASFKNVILQTELGGTVSGIVTKTFNGSNLVLVLNSLDDINLTEPRCEPLDINDFNVIFSEDFEEAIDNTNLNIEGWTNFAEEGGELWTEQVFAGNGYAEFSGYLTGDPVNIGWLVSPGIDMDTQSNEFLNFKTAQHHLDSEDNTLEIYVSTDFDGSDVLSANWTPISPIMASMSDSWYQFIDSGLIDISSYSGTLHVAFKVTGSGTNTILDGAYFVEDFVVLATN
jgi:hypothetical protein